MVSGTRSAEQGLWDADSLIPVTGLQLPLLIPSPFFLKCPFPICHCVQCLRDTVRGAVTLPLALSRYRSLKVDFFPLWFDPLSVCENLSS